MALQTEYEFTLPRGFVDKDGNLHKKGVMRLATAKDEIAPLTDFRVQKNRAYLVVILLSRVMSKLGTLTEITTDTVAGKDHRRNVSIIILGPDGKTTHQYNYLDCFLTEYRLTPLDADSEQECEEEVKICVGYSDNYLKA